MRAFLLLLLAVPAAALDIDREDYRIIGWNDACTVGVERYAYPRLGEAIQNEPITSRLGTLGIISDRPVVETRWVFEADGTNTYDRPSIDASRKKMRKSGYDRPGFSETIRNAVTADAPGAAEVILSTAIFEARPDFWPDTREWRLAAAHYNPLTTCALLIYEKKTERERYKFLLTRIYNPSSRSDRGRAHTTNGRVLFNNGELNDALAETEIGARMAPELASTHYNYAAMLALTGHLDEALRELLASIKIDKRYGTKAAEDLDFESLHPRQDYQELILKQERKGPMPPP